MISYVKVILHAYSLSSIRKPKPPRQVASSYAGCGHADEGNFGWSAQRRGLGRHQNPDGVDRKRARTRNAGTRNATRPLAKEVGGHACTTCGRGPRKESAARDAAHDAWKV